MGDATLSFCGVVCDVPRAPLFIGPHPTESLCYTDTRRRVLGDVGHHGVCVCCMSFDVNLVLVEVPAM